MQINWYQHIKNYPKNAMMLSSWYVACMVLIVTVIRQTVNLWEMQGLRWNIKLNCSGSLSFSFFPPGCCHVPCSSDFLAALNPKSWSATLTLISRHSHGFYGLLSGSSVLVFSVNLHFLSLASFFNTFMSWHFLGLLPWSPASLCLPVLQTLSSCLVSYNLFWYF